MSKKSAPASPYVSMKDIAHACGLSVMTVSRALRDTHVVNPQTRERVLAEARRMGYVPNRLASSFGRQKTMSVGIVIPDVDHTFFPALIKSLETALSAEDYHLLLCCSYDQLEKEAREIQTLLERRVDGIILAPVSTRKSREAVTRVQAMSCPLVLIDRLIPGLEADTVTVDDFEGAFQIVTHLIGQGYHAVAHIAGPADIWTADERLRGYRQAMAKAGLAVRPDSIVRAGLTVADGEAAMEQIVNRPTRRPDAVFCCNDPVAVGAYKVLRRHGLRIPEEIGLAGFSDILEAEIMEVPLTTIAQDAGRLGQEAARLLLARMSGEAPPTKAPVHEVIKTRLVVRRSTQRRD